MDYSGGKSINPQFVQPQLPMGVFGFNPVKLSDELAMWNVPNSPVHPNPNAFKSDIELCRLNGSYHNFSNYFESSFAKPNIQRHEKEELKKCIQRPGQVIQVCGSPLVGKSFLVNETLSEIHSQAQGNNIIQHHIICKGFTSFTNVLFTLYKELSITESPNEMAPIHQIKAALKEWLQNHHHIFVFHKCEALLTNQKHHKLLEFLGNLSEMPNTTVIFTSYKLFPQQSNICTLKIGMLNSVTDIQALLNFHSFGNPNAQAPGYVSLIQRYNLCFPLGIIHFAQTYLQGRIVPQPDEIEKDIQKNSLKFLENCLGHRLSELNSWLQIEKLKWIVHFCQKMDGSCSTELLWNMTVEDDHSYTGWNPIQAHLEENFALCIEPGLKRLRFHPLVMLYFFKALESRRLILRGDWYDQSCNKVVKFLCRILDKTEIVSRCHGNKFALFTCLLPEWNNMKNAIQMGVYTRNYKVYWKVATMAASLLIKWTPDEATGFYRAMVESSRQNGFRSQRETAVLEGCLAYALAQGRDNSWKQASHHFHSSLDVLRTEDCSFFTSHILCNFARMLARQGKYDKAIRYFDQSKAMLLKSRTEDYEDQFYVSEGQREDQAVTIRILSTIPKIFQGKNVEALRELHVIMKEMEDKNLYHFEYSTVLNLMGLAVQRGGGDLKRAVFYYRQSLEERMHLINVCPQDLVVPYNNLAMLQATNGEPEKALQNLQKALSIRRQHGWKNYYTALTLTHIGDVHSTKLDRLDVALDYYCQADEILSEASKNHDLRCRLTLTLAHLSLAIDQKYSEVKSSLLPGSNPSLPGKGDYYMNGTGPHSSPGNSMANLAHAFYKKKSAKDYFQKVYSLVRQSKGTLSDHGHNQLIVSLEHLILLESGNPAMISKYCRRIKDIITTYPWIVQELKKSEEERKAYLNKHERFYRYISSTEPDHLDVKILMELMLVNCTFCQNTETYFSKSAWEKIISQSQRQREEFLSKCNMNESGCNLVFAPEPIEIGFRETSMSNIKTDSDLSESPQGQNSSDIYMKIGFVNFNQENDEIMSNVSSSDGLQSTQRKQPAGMEQSFPSNVVYAEANIIKTRAVDHNGELYLSNEDNTHYVLQPALNGHRSMEEASWRENGPNFSINSDCHRQESIQSGTKQSKNIPYLSIMYKSSTDGSSLEELPRNNNYDYLQCVKDDELQKNLVQTFKKQCQGSLDYNLNNNANEIHTYCDTCSQENVLNRSDRTVPVESGYASGNSGMNGSKCVEDVKKLDVPGEYPVLTNGENFLYQNMDSTKRTYDHHDYRAHDLSHTSTSPVQCYNGLDSGILQNSKMADDMFLFGKLSNGTSEMPVNSMISRKMTASDVYGITEQLSKQTLHGRRFPLDEQTSHLDHKPEGAIQWRRLPSEQDERDLK